jgi:hypothetical protein
LTWRVIQPLWKEWNMKALTKNTTDHFLISESELHQALGDQWRFKMRGYFESFGEMVITRMKIEGDLFLHDYLHDLLKILECGLRSESPLTYMEKELKNRKWDDLNNRVEIRMNLLNEYQYCLTAILHDEKERSWDKLKEWNESIYYLTLIFPI